MSSDDDEFIDAEEEAVPTTNEAPPAEQEDLDEFYNEIDQVQDCLNLFLNSKFNEAQEILVSKRENSLYHSVGYSVILFLKAMMTFEPQDIQQSIQVLKETVEVADTFRKKEGFATSFARQVGIKNAASKFVNMTHVERHAELVYAECYIMKALLTVLNDDGTGFITVIKEGVNIRNSYLIYKAMEKFYNNCKEEGKLHLVDIHLRSQFFFGLGLFNIMLSLLPGRVLKLVQFIGFSANKALGLSYLRQQIAEKEGIGNELCKLGLLLYNTVICQILHIHDADIKECERILDSALLVYPNSALYWFFNGRLNYCKGNITEAIKSYDASIKCQSDWKNLHLICFWDKLINNALICNYKECKELATQLSQQSKWSKAIMTHYKAIFTYMEVYPEANDNVQQTYAEVPKLIKKIAGKHIPAEKYAARKARKFKLQGNFLMFPMLEPYILWNGIKHMPKEHKENWIEQIDKQLARFGQPLALSDSNSIHAPSKYIHANFMDDMFLLYFAKACFLKYNGKADESLKQLTMLLTYSNQVELDHWYIPMCHLELCRSLMDLGRYQEAINQLDLAKKRKKYSLENSIHIRMHSCRVQLSALMGEEDAKEDEEFVEGEELEEPEEEVDEE